MNEQQTQIQLMQIAQQKQRMAGPLIEQRMNDEPFPVELIPAGWFQIMRKAIRKIQPYSVKAKLSEFANMLLMISKDHPRISLNDFQIIANSLDVVSVDELELDEVAYKQLVDDTVKLVEVWQKKIKVINEEVIIEVETKFQMQKAAENGLRPVKE